MKIITIYGPPGTGKTTELMNILEAELKTYHPAEIAYVSFTREGSEQGRKRAMEKFNYSAAEFPYFRTLHSMAFQALRLNRDRVIGKAEYKAFSEKMGMRFTGYYTEELKHDDDMYLFFDELHRNNAKTARVYLDSLDAHKLTYVRKNYSAFKKASDLMDFTDMIEQFVEAGSAIPVKVAFIDEAQDLTTLQWKMVWTAFRNCDTVYIAGDDDQAIYQWSGADVEYFLSIEGESRILHHSYRLPNSVLAFAKRISSQISRRIDKTYEGRGEEGDIGFYNSVNEVKINPDETYMFLTRNHAFIPSIEEALRKKVAVYTIKGEPSVSKEDLAAIVMYEDNRKTGAMNQQAAVRLSRYLRPKYSLQAPWYESFKWDENRIAYMRDIVRTKPDISAPKIRVNTIHSSKGAEADNVVLLLDITRNVALNLGNNPDSEHRAFYVGATRAKKTLHIVHANTRNAYPIY